MVAFEFFFFFSSRRRHTRCALVTGVQTCALPICQIGHQEVKVFKDLRQEDWSHAWQARFVEAARRLIGRVDAVLAAAGNFAGPAGLPQPGSRLAGLEGLAMIAVLLPAAARHDLGFALTGKGGQVLDDLERALDKLEAYRAEKKKLSLAWSDAAIAAASLRVLKAIGRAPV